MEIIKDALTARKDFMTLLSTAPPPFPAEIEAKLNALKFGSPSTVPGASSSIPQVSGSAPLAPAPQNLVSLPIQPPAAVAPQRVQTAASSSFAPQAVTTIATKGSPTPLPRRPYQSSPRNSSRKAWKWVFAIALLAGGIYLVRRYQKKKEQEKR